MKTLITSLCLVSFVLLGGRLEATAISFNTSESQFDAGIDNQGWWSATAINTDNNDSYFTGGAIGQFMRSFFTFDLSTLDLSGQTLLSATFEAVRYAYGSGDPSETVAFFDVSTPAAALNDNAGTSAAIFADLGTGTSYGSFVVPAYEASSTQTLMFSLNAGALANITAGAGGFFSIGGSLQGITLLRGAEAIFSSSAGPGMQRLVLETQPGAAAVPEPASILLLGSGLIATNRLRKRRRTQ